MGDKISRTSKEDILCTIFIKVFLSLSCFCSIRCIIDSCNVDTASGICNCVTNSSICQCEKLMKIEFLIIFLTANNQSTNHSMKVQ